MAFAGNSTPGPRHKRDKLSVFRDFYDTGVLAGRIVWRQNL